jgi:hypothetical protein
MRSSRRGNDDRMRSSRTERNMSASGGRLLLIGTVMIIAGLALALALDHTASGIGLAITALGAVPFFGGLGLWLSALLSKSARSDKPYA